VGRDRPGHQGRAGGRGRRPALRPPADDQAATFRGWWDEFEAGETPEARLAHAVDRLSALVVNHAEGGRLWREHGRTEAVARARNEQLAAWVPGLGPLVTALLDDAAANGWFADPADP
jgi:putative hydrolase of HD superfamily